jgi:hypothetical protein
MNSILWLLLNFWTAPTKPTPEFPNPRKNKELQNFFHPTSSYKVMGEEASIDQLKIKKICSAIAGPTTSALTKPEWSHKRHWRKIF